MNKWEGRAGMRNVHTGAMGTRDVIGMTRRSLLGSAVAVVAGAGTAAAVGSGTAPVVPALWREFSHTPFTHPQIPYVGRAGYRGGAVRFSRRPFITDVR